MFSRGAFLHLKRLDPLFPHNFSAYYSSLGAQSRQETGEGRKEGGKERKKKEKPERLQAHKILLCSLLPSPSYALVFPDPEKNRKLILYRLSISF
jgi:hypothetical protein